MNLKELRTGEIIYGIGVDIIEISRFDKNPPSERFMLKCFSERELNHLKRKSHEHISGLLAAKEAVVKALGVGFSGFSPSVIEILFSEKGAPYTELKNKAARIAEQAGVIRILISVSHSRSFAVGFACALSNAK